MFYTLNTGAKVNPSTGEGSDFYNREEGQVLYGVEVSTQGFNRDTTRFGQIIGYVDAESRKFGTVPATRQPHYVMK